jgi:predicted PurR-regulated permease PerM
MKLVGGLLLPIIFAVFVAILCLPVVRWFQPKGLRIR